MSKKIVSFLICMLLAIQIPNIVSATPSNLQISIDGELLSLPLSPVQVNGTTMVPIAPIFRYLDLTLQVDGKSLKGSKIGLVIHMVVGSKIARVNGVTVILSEPVELINNTTMVPLRFIVDCLGASVSSAEGIIHISNNNSSTMYDIDLPVQVTGNYVVNLRGEEFLELNIVDFFYDPITKKVSEYDFYSSVIGFNFNTSYKYNSFQVGKQDKGDEIYIGSAIKFLEDFDHNVQNNTNYSKVKAYYESQDFLDQVRAFIKSEKDANDAKLKKAQDASIAKLKIELKANKNKPIKLISTEVTYNLIDIPEVNLTIKNLTTKTIVAYEMRVSCYDDFDRPVNRFLSSSNLFKGISQGNNLTSGQSQTDTWTLNLYDLATKVKNIKITAVKFSDGTSWKL
ncbi:copper amine oxidase N-terminal domain-containing protein [Cohnella herbarum]|uniref:Copper amine oxidase N-terminal domain-containing protein n=1 Tax=Cohnella herbarum TaxID=2728023 RepID=A0A7Z2VQ75_9BACL|nr:copper amine oxidase N-terminal domain-containing protein [Cohnella herbarum]QJD87282.1 copper amine oxidase N-terminal domain-containing protein [Cohnella herbarum]